MNAHEFQSQINRLSEHFGKTKYSREFCQLLWKEVEQYPEFWFRSAVDEFIGDLSSSPLIKDFRERLSKEKQKANYREKKAREEQGFGNFDYNCQFCKDLGIYLCAYPEKPGLWAFRCQCDIGSQDSRNIPQFKQVYSQDGFYWFDVKPIKQSK